MGRRGSSRKYSAALPGHRYGHRADRLMADLDYGKGYKYSHDFPEHFVSQQYLPDKAANTSFWTPQMHTVHEAKLGERMKRWWKREKSQKDTAE
mgnify:CR=1 FL=1